MVFVGSLAVAIFCGVFGSVQSSLESQYRSFQNPQLAIAMGAPASFYDKLFERVRREFGVCALQAQELVTEYAKFLALKVILKDYDAKILSSSPSIGKVWHLHLIDNRNYQSVVDQVCDIHSVVRAPIYCDPEGELDVAARQHRRETTRVAYTARYGHPPPEVWDDDYVIKRHGVRKATESEHSPKTKRAKTEDAESQHSPKTNDPEESRLQVKLFRYGKEVNEIRYGYGALSQVGNFTLWMLNRCRDICGHSSFHLSTVSDNVRLKPDDDILIVEFFDEEIENDGCVNLNIIDHQ